VISPRVAYFFPAERHVALSNLAPHYFFSAFRANHHLDLLFDGEDFSLFDRRRPREYAVIFIGLSYEPTYLTLVKYLRKHGIPVLRRERPLSQFPLLIAGGMAPSLHPKPLLEICDVVLCGEAEAMYHDLTMALDDLTTAVAYLSGLPYAASAHRKHLVVRAHPGSFAVCTHPDLVGFGNEFSGHSIFELNRGCPGTCRFCAARHLYGAEREADYHRIVRAVEESFARGENVAFLGTGVEAVSYFEDLLERAVVAGRSVSLSSVRIDGLTAERAARLATAGIKTITIAPESLIFQTRRHIGKPISDEQICTAFELAKKHRFKVKLYLMAGLPGSDSESEAEAIVSFFAFLTQQRLTVPVSLSVTPFCPKPGTPFHSHSLMAKREYEQFRSTVMRGVRKVMPRMPVEWFSWREALLQTAFCRMGAAEGGAFLSAYAESGNIRAAEERSGVTLSSFTGVHLG